jgi:hypothetical protein
MSHRGPARRRTLGFAVAVGALMLYAVGAEISGHLSLIARRPILDGPTPPPPYNYVNPPPALAATNQKPPGLRVTVALDRGGSVVASMVTPDKQLLLSMPEGIFAPRRGATGVLVVAEPVDPAALPPLPGRLEATGNAYRISATYEPGSEAIASLRSSASALLLYPVVVNLHATDHTLFLSPDGKSWQILRTIDTPNLVQAQASVPALGYLVVGAHLQPIASAAPAGGGIPGTWLLIAGAFLILGLEFAFYSLRERSR